jgi:hypothetical protein
MQMGIKLLYINPRRSEFVYRDSLLRCIELKFSAGLVITSDPRVAICGTRIRYGGEVF